MFLVSRPPAWWDDCPPSGHSAPQWPECSARRSDPASGDDARAVATYKCHPITAMSRKEVIRPGLLRALVKGHLTNRQVAGALRVTVRHVQRLKRRFAATGPRAWSTRGAARLRAARRA